MKSRYALPVAILSVVVLAFTVAFTGGIADAAETATAVSQATIDGAVHSDNHNANENVNKNLNKVEVVLDLSGLGLDFESSWTSVEVKRNEEWDNTAIIKDRAYNHSVGVNQAVVVSGADNSVSQRSLAIYVDADSIHIGDATGSLL